MHPINPELWRCIGKRYALFTWSSFGLPWQICVAWMLFIALLAHIDNQLLSKKSSVYLPIVWAPPWASSGQKIFISLYFFLHNTLPSIPGRKITLNEKTTKKSSYKNHLKWLWENEVVGWRHLYRGLVDFLWFPVRSFNTFLSQGSMFNEYKCFR